MRGRIEKRGKASWRVVVFLGRDTNGKRQYDRATVQGLKRDADAKLAEILNAIGKGTHVRNSRLSIAEFIPQRIDAWASAGEIGGNTEDGYRRIFGDYIKPHLGMHMVQALKAIHVERWHHKLRARGLSARTITSAHRVLGKAMKEAVRFELAVRNPCSAPGGGQAAPKVAKTEAVSYTEPEVVLLLDALNARHTRRGQRGRPHRLGRQFLPKVMVALFGGLRRSELLALHWGDIDLETGVLHVRRALEETKKYGLRVKATKTEAGQRVITLPTIVIEALTDHRREQLEVRMRLALGRDDAPVFPALDGGYQSPRGMSGDWREFLTAAKLRKIPLHSVRHTAASMLIAASQAKGVEERPDLVEISKRIGHADPSITLRIYSHLFHSDDSRSADALNRAVVRLGKT